MGIEDDIERYFPKVKKEYWYKLYWYLDIGIFYSGKRAVEFPKKYIIWKSMCQKACETSACKTGFTAIVTIGVLTIIIVAILLTFVLD